MTRLMEDIRAQPAELNGILARTAADDSGALRAAARQLNAASHVYVAGIGSSYHAGMAVQAVFDSAVRACRLVDASEMQWFPRLPGGSVLVLLSRSGRSYEIVELLATVKAAGTKVIGITNTPDSPLAQASDVVLPLAARFDHLVSVTMYSGLALAGALLAAAAADGLDESLTRTLSQALAESRDALTGWSRQIDGSGWLPASEPAYFLGRGASTASCHEARLLWEEAAKSPATAMNTGAYRHGSQESIRPGLRIGLWLDRDRMRSEDIALARDARRHGVRVLAIAQDPPTDCGELVIRLPAIPALWQFLIDIMPAQIAAEGLSRRREVDCDSFRLCPYVIETSGGL